MEKHYQIHLIDDDQNFCFLARKILFRSKFDADMQISINGKAALEYLEYASMNPELKCPDIIILDINMPVMNGWDFLNEFRELKRKIDAKIPVLVLSSSVDPEDKKRALSYDEVSDYISKPLTTGFFDTLEMSYLSR
jgi:CheY-like chemotaxis protein